MPLFYQYKGRLVTGNGRVTWKSLMRTTGLWNSEMRRCYLPSLSPIQTEVLILVLFHPVQWREEGVFLTTYSCY
ncbi:hypothetical protein TcWFU_008673 [Taenia crassiceps]|uniref:Uncharacterized protein n=1 Tax=Taenia crassiceps TaxID=6207 RepID=A0ABR4QCA6_9CEST